MSQQLNTNDSLLTEHVEEDELDAIQSLFFSVAGMGKYQKLTLVFWCTCLYLCGGVTLIIPYLFYQDPYLCPDAPVGQTCNSYVCSLPPAQRAQFIPPTSMSTMTNEFGDYRCSPQSSTLDLAVMLIYSSTVFSYLLLAIFGDYLGRKKFMIIGLLLTIGGILISIFAVNLLMGAMGMFIGSLGTLWLYSISMLYVTETVSDEYRQNYLVICQFFYGIGHLFNAGYYYFLLDWQLVFIYCYLIPAVATLIAVLAFVIDSPLCLIRKLAPEEVKRQFLWVASINGVHNPDLDVQRIQELKEMDKIREKKESEASKFTFVDLFRYPSLRTTTICLAILESCILFLFYAPTLMIAEFQFDIYINGVVIGASSLLAYPLCYFMVSKVKRKTLALVSFSIILLLSITLIFLWHPRNDEVPQPVSENIGSLSAFFLISFLITMEYIIFEVYLLELYPTQVRLIGGSFVTFFSGITISFSDFIIDGCERAGFSVMIIFTIFAVLSILSSLKLPQTFGKTPLDFIQELSQRINSMEHHSQSHIQILKQA